MEKFYFLTTVKKKKNTKLTTTFYPQKSTEQHYILAVKLVPLSCDLSLVVFFLLREAFHE